MKTTYRKLKPRIVYYHDFKYFCNTSFTEIYGSFAVTCNKILDNHVPLKKKYVRGNHSPFMKKFLSKAIMVRTRLRNISLKNRSEENKINYNKQRNFFVTLLRKNKREYYQKLRKYM